MTIEHLVISGGGPNGFKFLGALEELHDQNFWNIENIKTIYCTSVGSMIATMLSLKYDWETLNTYLIDRPWKELFKIKPKQILEAYSNKGVINISHLEKTLKPLLVAKDLNINITMKEFYEYSSIELHMFTVELNSFQVEDISYLTHPELRLIEAIYMSSSIPSLIQPLFYENKCYIDGGLLANYPIQYCIQRFDKETILGIKTEYASSNKSILTSDATILEFVVNIFIKYMEYISILSVNQIEIPYEVKCKGSMISIGDFKDLISEQLIRKDWIESGKKEAQNFLQSKLQNSKTSQDSLLSV
jgi:predicted acylesterase/phospholipase RssA